METAIVASFHNYTPMYDKKYYKVLSDYFFRCFSTIWGKEVDKVYLLDSSWGIDFKDEKIVVIKTNPNLRYYDAYKEALGHIQADKVLFMDNDMLVWEPGHIKKTFNLLDEFDVVSIYDTIGKRTYNELGGKSKFCLYWFASKKNLLMRYRGVDWGSNMPKHETLGELTRVMLRAGLKPYEWEEDKTDYADKNLGYFHVRAGTTVAYLLTHRDFGDKETYTIYLKNQPKSELMRHVFWYEKMGGNADVIKEDLSKKP